MLITPTARAPRRLFATLAAALALAVGFSGLAATTTLDAADAAVGNAMTPLAGFTVLTQGNAALGSAGEFEGSLAAGGDVSFTTYNLNANNDGSPLPVVDGLSDVQLFVGGTVAISGSATKLDVNAGRTRITDTAGLTVTDGTRLGKSGVNGYVLTQGAYSQNTIAGTGASSYTATANGYNTAFPASTFTTLAASSSSYAALTADSDVVLVGPATSGGELGLTLTAGKVNVWNVSSSVFAGQTALNLNGAMPSATTRLIINVTDGNGGKLDAVRINNVDPRYVLWNFPGWATLKVQGNAKFSGSILAPMADLTYSNGSDFNGQIAAKTFTIDTAAEIHHVGYSAPAPKSTVAGTWSTTTQCAAPSNQLVVDAVEGVKYTWTAGGTGEFTAFSQKDLLGTYAFTVSVTDSATYTLGTNPTSFSTTFTSPSGCNPPSTQCIPPSLVRYTYTATTNSGTVTVPNPAGYNGVLCKPFWVTAVAWKYMTTAVWPQALDVENAMSNNEGGTQITKAGSYTYGAPVVCGQGDIYASFVNQKQSSPTLSGVGQLNGPQTPFPENFLHGMGFQGPTPTYDKLPAGCNQAAPVAPTMTPITLCDTYGSLTVGSGNSAVRLTATSRTATVGGVVYTLTSGNGSFGTWEVTATPAANRYFDGPQKVVYSGDLKARTSCVASVEPKIEGATCDSSTGTITSAYIVIPSTKGLLYSVDGAAYQAGDVVQLGTGTHTVTVATEPGYTNTGQTEFTLVVKAYPDACTAPTVVTGAATASAQTCDVDYALQQGSVLATARPGVTYQLWDQGKTASIASLTAGTPRPTANGSYNVRVVPAEASYKVLPADEWILVTVDPYTGDCSRTDVSGSASAAGETCSANDYISTKPADYTVALGSVTANSAKGVTYELWNRARTDRIAVLTADAAYPIAGGTYAVKVLPASNSFSVSAANEWIAVVVPKNSQVCEVIGDPTVFQQCVANALDPNTSDWTSYLTIVAADRVQYRVFFKSGDVWVDQGVWAAGRYDAGTAKLPYDTVVKVVAEADAGWSLLAPKSWNFTVQKAFNCNLPEFGIVTPVVTFAQTCEAGSSYALSIVGGVPGTVLWSVNGGPQTTQLGTFTASAPSTVKIVASPAPGSGFDGDGLPRTFERTFTDPAACDLETLAFTGQNVTLYLVIAVILFQAGLALVAVQFIRARRRARHLAAD